MKLRNRSGDFDASGSCNHLVVTENPDGKEQLGCGVDCDGGGIQAELLAENKSTLVRLESIRISTQQQLGRGRLKGGADDREFRLDRVSLELCRSLVTDRKELAAMRRK